MILDEAYPYIKKKKLDDEPARLSRHRRIRVSQVVVAYQACGGSIEETCRQHPLLTVVEIHAAMLYYLDHRQEIDNEIRTEREGDEWARETTRPPKTSLRTSDEEHVERTRRALVGLVRWRPWLIGLYLLGIVFLGSIVLIARHALFGWVMQPQFPPGWMGFVVGIIAGLMVGGLGMQLVHGLTFALFEPRNERLLIKYYDELQSLLRRGDSHV